MSTLFMDFLDPKKKRAHKIRLYIGYLLMAIALSIGTLILLLETKGFDVDRRTGEVIHNGLVFVDAHPETAKVYLNGKLEGNTDTRLTIPTGDYTLEMQREGYRSWKKSFILKGSAVERFNYAFLFPTDLKTEDLELYGTLPEFATQSPDRKWVLVLQPGKLDTFDVYNLQSANLSQTTIKLPSGLINTSTDSHAYKIVEWSNDNRHAVIKHTYKGGSEFIILDREKPEESININKTFNTSISEVALSDKKWDKLHLLDSNGGVLRFADLKPKTMSVIATGILSFKTYGEEVLTYITNQNVASDKVAVFARKGNNTYKIREMSKGKKYLVDVTMYDKKWFMAAGTDTDKSVYIYEDVFDYVKETGQRSPPPVAVLKLKKLENLSVSANTRFIGIQGGSEFATYDAEYDRQHRFETGIKLAPGFKATWMDGHRYTVVSAGKLVVFEFDGTNKQTLATASPNFLPFFDRDYDNLFMLSPSDAIKGRASINRTPMRTEADL